MDNEGDLQESYRADYSSVELVHIAKLNGRICGAKRPHSVSEQPKFYQSM